VPERPRTERIAFRTRSEIEILDDGYKWRKYGKKSVKNSPNPRYIKITIHQEHHTITSSTSTRISRSGCSHLDGWIDVSSADIQCARPRRNYYRCSTEGCNVKKRVERDKDDPSYVVTTYEGTHNHVSPSTVYYASQDATSGRFFVAGTQPPGSLN
jgi:hypothetical protein